MGSATIAAGGGLHQACCAGVDALAVRSAQQEDRYVTDIATRHPAMDTRTPSALGIGLLAAAGYPVWPAPARRVPSPTSPAPVAATSLVPAEEAQELLRRVESLLVDARH